MRRRASKRGSAGALSRSASRPSGWSCLSPPTPASWKARTLQVLQPARLALWAAHAHALLGVELIEGEDGYLGPGRRAADVLEELMHGRQVREGVGVGSEMVEGDEG